MPMFPYGADNQMVPAPSAQPQMPGAPQPSQMDLLQAMIAAEKAAEQKKLQDFLLPLGIAQEQGAGLQDQLKLAQALRSQPGQHHSTGWGAGLGMVGDLFRQAAGMRDERAARDQMQQLMDQRAEILRNYGK